MKRSFVCWISLLLMLSGFATAATNLQLILEGSFVVCEAPGNGATPKRLNVVIPNLASNHFVPGLMSTFEQLSMGKESDLTAYQEYPESTDYRLDVWKDNNHNGAMKLMPQTRPTSQPAAYFYSEKGDCNSLDRSYESVALIVPLPDEVWTFNPTAPIQILHHEPNDLKTQVLAECKKADECTYATKIVLRYTNVDVDNLNVKWKDSNSNIVKWPYVDSTQIAAANSINNEIQIELSTVPMPAPTEKEANDHVRAAFRLASKLSGVPRAIAGDPVVITDSKGKPHALDATDRIFPPAHRVCQGVPIFVCTTGNACN